MKKRLSVLVLAFAMVLTMSVSVFAAGNGVNSGNNNGDDSFLPGSAKLVAYLTVGKNVDPPVETFTFTFTPVDVTGADATAYTVPASEHPQNKTATIATSALTKTGSDGAKPDLDAYSGSVAISDIFTKSDFMQGNVYRAGEYTFTVAETEGSTVGMTYAADTYTLKLIVDKDGNIDDVTVQNEDGDKVDPTDEDPSDNTGGATPEASNGGFTFTNDYVKMVETHKEPGEDPDDPSDDSTVAGALKVEKLVEGEYGDYTKAFEFSVRVTLPSNTPSSYTLPTPNTNIKSGESFVYGVLPAGSKITITETPVSGYTTTFAGYEGAVSNGTEFILSEDGQFVKVTNAFDDESVTPTGIIINNLPYILLIGLALGGIVLFSRKRRYE